MQIAMIGCGFVADLYVRPIKNLSITSSHWCHRSRHEARRCRQLVLCRRILVMGATSAIAEATAREFARRGDSLFLVGRNAGRLQAIVDDLKLRGVATVATQVHDARDVPGYEALLQAATQALGGLDTALIPHVTLSDQATCQQSVPQMLDEFNINALSVIALCTLLANSKCQGTASSR